MCKFSTSLEQTSRHIPPTGHHTISSNMKEQTTATRLAMPTLGRAYDTLLAVCLFVYCTNNRSSLIMKCLPHTHL